jgi:hypothetical protein
MVRFLQGIRVRPLPSVEEALAHRYDAHEEALRLGRGSHLLVGGVARVRERIATLVRDSCADEVMVMTHVHEHAARKRSYELRGRGTRHGVTALPAVKRLTLPRHVAHPGTRRALDLPAKALARIL